MASADKTAKAACKTERKDSVTGNEIAPVEPFQDINRLTAEQIKTLAQHEVTIRAGIKSYLDVGEALCEISEQRLYREQFGTFAEYCQVKWNITARHANRLMRAFELVENLKSDPGVSSAAIPTTEKEGRPLQGLSPEQQREAVKLAQQKSPKPTAIDHQAAAKEVTAKSHDEEPDIEADEPEEKPRVTSHTPLTPSIHKTSSSEDEDDGEAYDLLLTMVDTAQTQARKTSGCSEVTKQLGDIAKRVQQIKAKGGQ